MEHLDALQLLNIAIATVTLAGCIYLVFRMFGWRKRLVRSRTELRPFVTGVAEVKAALGFLAVLNIVHTLWNDNTQPLITLPARLLIMYAVIKQVIVTLRVGPAPVLPESLEEELDKDGRFILIVEDEEGLARWYRRVIEQVGLNAEFATNPADALTIMGLEPLRLLIVDLGLPGMDGVELVKRAREQGYDGPVVAVTGGGPRYLDMDKVGESTFVQVLPKPTPRKDLIAAVHKWVAP